MLTSRFLALWRYRDLLWNLVLRDLRVKYKGSTLGFGWSLLHPLLMAAVYTLAFKYIVRIRVQHFPVFLLSGLLPWTFFGVALSAATGSVADNAPLVRKVAFPRAMLPLSSVASQFVQFVLMYAVIVVVVALFSVGPSFALLALVPLLVLQLAFTTGMALACATAYVYFRDTRHLLEVGLQLWFWLTPVVYPLTLVPEAYQRYFALNPMALVVTSYQRIVLDRALPSLWTFAALIVVAGATAAAGLLIFFRHERRFGELV
jgi:ABC-type polysaccharide/polyol phosphate export permease